MIYVLYDKRCKWRHKLLLWVCMTEPTSQPPHNTFTGRVSGSVYARELGGRVRYQTIERAEGDEAGTEQTINLMRRLASDDALTPQIQAAAAIATHGARTEREAAQGIFNYMKARVRFRDDATAARPLSGVLEPEDAEILIRPVDLLQMERPQGDCDDFAMSTAALLIAAGIRPQFVTIAADPASANYSHVFTRAHLPGGPIAMDTSHGRYMGWQARPTGKSKTWEFADMRQPSLGAIDWGKIVEIGANAGAQIATKRYAQAPVGTYSQGADGSINFRQPANASALTFPGVNVGGSSTLLLVGGAAVLLFAFMAMGGRR